MPRGAHFCFGEGADAPTLHFNRRSIEPTALSCSKAHSKRHSATLPSFRFSTAANSSRASLNSRRTRKLICAFHSPMVHRCVSEFGLGRERAPAFDAAKQPGYGHAERARHDQQSIEARNGL